MFLESDIDCFYTFYRKRKIQNAVILDKIRIQQKSRKGTSPWNFIVTICWMNSNPNAISGIYVNGRYSSTTTGTKWRVARIMQSFSYAVYYKLRDKLVSIITVYYLHIKYIHPWYAWNKNSGRLVITVAYVCECRFEHHRLVSSKVLLKFVCTCIKGDLLIITY